MTDDMLPDEAQEDFGVTLSTGFDQSERGNILLMNLDGDFNAWIDLSEGEEDVRLEVSWRPDNYPALHVRLVKVSAVELFEHLVQAFDSGWEIIKLNLASYTEQDLRMAWHSKKGEQDGAQDSSAAVEEPKTP